jgi:hypothetical protein
MYRMSSVPGQKIRQVFGHVCENLTSHDEQPIGVRLYTITTMYNKHCQSSPSHTDTFVTEGIA